MSDKSAHEQAEEAMLAVESAVSHVIATAEACGMDAAQEGGQPLGAQLRSHEATRAEGNLNRAIFHALAARAVEVIEEVHRALDGYEIPYAATKNVHVMRDFLRAELAKVSK